MELSFSSLRAKEVVNTQDGRRLGKICDIALCYPDNRWIGIVVPDGKGWGRRKNELFIDLKRIVKIGEDVVLVNVGLPRRQENGKRGLFGRGVGRTPSNCSPAEDSCSPNGRFGCAPSSRNGSEGVGEASYRNFEECE